MSIFRGSGNWRCAIAVAFLLVSLNSNAQSQQFSSAQKIQEAQELLFAGKCNDAWRIAWPLVKNGDEDALLFVLGVMFFTRLVPPGHKALAYASKDKDYLTLAVFAAAIREKRGAAENANWIRKDIPIWIKQIGSLGPAGERVSQCYESKNSFRECSALALSLGVVPPLDEFVRQFEARAGDSEAICWPH
jgi:hypothetical protein